jgi:hypothetical protein
MSDMSGWLAEYHAEQSELRALPAGWDPATGRDLRRGGGGGGGREMTEEELAAQAAARQKQREERCPYGREAYSSEFGTLNRCTCGSAAHWASRGEEIGKLKAERERKIREEDKKRHTVPEVEGRGPLVLPTSDKFGPSPCRDKDACANANCGFAHPATWQHHRDLPWLECSAEHGRRRCRMAAECDNKRCGFAHPANWRHHQMGARTVHCQQCKPAQYRGHIISRFRMVNTVEIHLRNGGWAADEMHAYWRKRFHATRKTHIF